MTSTPASASASARRTPGPSGSVAPAVSASRPVTVLVTRRVKSGREEEFEAFLDQLRDEAASLPGYLGMAVIRPTGSSREYAVLYRFDSPEHMSAWRNSPVRAALVAASTDLAEEASNVRELCGLDTWFAVPSGQVVRPPARWKMWLLSVCAIYPAITLLTYAAGPLLAPLALPLRSAVLTPVLSALMTWVLMPTLSRWSARWLYR